MRDADDVLAGHVALEIHLTCGVLQPQSDPDEYLADVRLVPRRPAKVYGRAHDARLPQADDFREPSNVEEIMDHFAAPLREPIVIQVLEHPPSQE